MKAICLFLLFLSPALGIARGTETTIKSRTAYFPLQQGSEIVIKAQQGPGSYTGARRTLIVYGKRKLTPTEINDIKSRGKFGNGKFGTSRTDTVTYIKKQAF